MSEQRNEFDHKKPDYISQDNWDKAEWIVAPSSVTCDPARLFKVLKVAEVLHSYASPGPLVIDPARELSIRADERERCARVADRRAAAYRDFIARQAYMSPEWKTEWEHRAKEAEEIAMMLRARPDEERLK